MSAYLDGLKLLSRRELSEHQVRLRLARKGHAAPEVDEAIERLKADRSLDDRRTAEALARTEALVRRRGRIRVRRALDDAGIPEGLARQALETVFASVDEDEAIAAALGRRLRGDRPIGDDREFQRLYRYLVSRGFESGRVLSVLRAHRRAGPPGGSSPDDLP